MRRREFITLLGGAATSAAWPPLARAQRAAMPVVGVLRSTPVDDATNFTVPLGQGLSDIGYIVGKNVSIDYHSTSIYDRLPAMASDLVRKNVAVIVGSGAVNAPLAAKAATTTIPIVFVIGSDPVQTGLVASLNRPGGNVTGVTLLGGTLIQKRLELLREMIPSATSIGFLVNPSNPNTEAEVRELRGLAQAGGWALHVVTANDQVDLDEIFAMLAQRRVGAFLHSSDIFFSSRYPKIVALAERHKLPAIYTRREVSFAGGLVSYGPRPADIYRLGGTYVGRILKGERPADLPVQLPTRFELVINLKTAKALSLEVPTTLLARADEVIE
jgi:putative ABC transport system substrate-binding protein